MLPLSFIEKIHRNIYEYGGCSMYIARTENIGPGKICIRIPSRKCVQVNWPSQQHLMQIVANQISF